MTTALSNFLTRLLKAKLHLHLQETLEPSMMLTLAARNAVTLPYSTVEEGPAENVRGCWTNQHWWNDWPGSKFQ